MLIAGQFIARDGEQESLHIRRNGPVSATQSIFWYASTPVSPLWPQSRTLSRHHQREACI